MANHNPYTVPIKEKVLVTITEAAAYTGVGQNKIEELISGENAKRFVVMNGNRRMIKRELFAEFLLNSTEI